MTDITEEYHEALKEIISIGIGKVSTTLSEILEDQSDVRFSVPQTDLIKRSDCADLDFIKEVEGKIATVTLEFHGPFSGNVGLVIPMYHARKLVEVMTEESQEEEDFEETLQDTMGEVGNMLLNSLMGTISNIFMEKLQYEVPQYGECDKEDLFAQFDQNDSIDQIAILANTRFNVDAYAIVGDICIVFEISSFDQVLKSIDVTDLTRHLQGYRMMRDKALDELKVRKKIEQELREKNSEFEAFSRRVAHDLRNPLSFMKSMANFIIEYAEDPNKITHYAQMMHKNAERGLNIIDGIYQLSGLDSSKYNYENIEITNIVELARDNILQVIEATNTKLEIHCPHAVRGVRNLLPQVFQNLLSNSIKFCEEEKTPFIKVSSQLLSEGDVLIRFEDNGPGIAEKNRDKVFDAFERLHGVEVEGLGLGLNIVKKIVEMHNGKINLGDSSSLGGACFEIILNIRRSERKKVKQHRFIKLVSTKDPTKKLTLVLADESEHGVGGSCHSDTIPDIDEVYSWENGNELKNLKISWRKLDEQNERYYLGASFLEVS